MPDERHMSFWTFDKTGNTCLVVKEILWEVQGERKDGEQGLSQFQGGVAVDRGLMHATAMMGRTYK